MALSWLSLHDPRAADVWRTLEPRGHASPFLAWPWLHAWLSELAAPPRLAVVSERGAPVAAALFGSQRIVRHRVLASRTLFLHGTGLERHDAVFVEQVGAVGGPGALGRVLAALPDTWDEIVLPALPAEAVAEVTDPRLRLDRRVPAPYVELDKVRACGDYTSLLGSSTRAQLRKSRRAAGALAIETPRAPAEALAIFDELVALHDARWRKVGDPGAFADPWVVAFHRRLIAREAEAGGVELSRITSRGRTIGCLYNLVHRGRVAFYQSGLVDDPALRPGYLCHAVAIEAAATAGHAVYDFLAGTARYKRDLATADAPLAWMRLRQPRLRFRVEDALRACKRIATGRAGV